MIVSEGVFFGVRFSGASLGYKKLDGVFTSAAALANYFGRTSGKYERWRSPRQFSSHTGSSRSSVFQALHGWLNDTRSYTRKRAGTHQLSLVYFSCHARVFDGSVILLTSDTLPECPFETGVPLHSLYHILRTEAEYGRSFILVIDSCLEGTNGTFLERVPKNVSVVFASGAAGVATQTDSGTDFVEDFLHAVTVSARRSKKSARETANLLEVVQFMNSPEPKRFFVLSNLMDLEVPASSALGEGFAEEIGASVRIYSPRAVSMKDSVYMEVQLCDFLSVENLSECGIEVIFDPDIDTDEGITIKVDTSAKLIDLIVLLDALRSIEYMVKKRAKPNIKLPEWTRLDIDFEKRTDRSLFARAAKNLPSCQSLNARPDILWFDTDSGTLELRISTGICFVNTSLNEFANDFDYVDRDEISLLEAHSSIKLVLTNYAKLLGQRKRRQSLRST